MKDKKFIIILLTHVFVKISMILMLYNLLYGGLEWINNNESIIQFVIRVLINVVCSGLVLLSIDMIDNYLNKDETN